MFFDIKHTRRTPRLRCQPGAKKPLQLNGKKTCDTSIACCNVAHIFGSIFHVNAIKVRFCSWKNTKRKCIKQTCTKNRLQLLLLLLVTAIRVATKAGVKYRKFNFQLQQSIKKAKLKVCEKSFQLCCYNNLELFAFSSIHTKQYAECRMHHRSGTCMPVNQMLSQLGSPSYAWSSL